MNDALSAEVSVMTAAQPAEVQSGGMRTNMIPKDGGNIRSGAVFIGGSDGNWQANNIDDYLRSQNIQAANAIAHMQNFNGSLGGPGEETSCGSLLRRGTYRPTNSSPTRPSTSSRPTGEFLRTVQDTVRTRRASLR